MLHNDSVLSAILSTKVNISFLGTALVVDDNANINTR